MTTLLTRLSEATGPDREIDADIAIAVGWTCRLEFGMAGNWYYVYHDPSGLVSALPRYTGSVDDALTLVPEKHVWVLSNERVDRFGHVAAMATVFAIDSDIGKVRGFPGASPAIALCIAALRAREQHPASGVTVSPPAEDEPSDLPSPSRPQEG